MFFVAIFTDVRIGQQDEGVEIGLLLGGKSARQQQSGAGGQRAGQKSASVDRRQVNRHRDNVSQFPSRGQGDGSMF